MNSSNISNFPNLHHFCTSVILKNKPRLKFMCVCFVGPGIVLGTEKVLTNYLRNESPFLKMSGFN